MKFKNNDQYQGEWDQGKFGREGTFSQYNKPSYSFRSNDEYFNIEFDGWKIIFDFDKDEILLHKNGKNYTVNQKDAPGFKETLMLLAKNPEEIEVIPNALYNIKWISKGTQLPMKGGKLSADGEIFPIDNVGYLGIIGNLDGSFTVYHDGTLDLDKYKFIKYEIEECKKFTLKKIESSPYDQIKTSDGEILNLPLSKIMKPKLLIKSALTHHHEMEREMDMEIMYKNNPLNPPDKLFHEPMAQAMNREETIFGRFCRWLGF